MYTKKNNTYMLAGDAMPGATRIYQVLRVHRREGLDETIDVLAQRFTLFPLHRGQECPHSDVG